ncbi:MAG TPA: polysaccharide deacetylase family protein, partial [Bacillota bacterium]|nr:polysaccharide deacetylase family protein [Bacillota bacterium]
YYSRLAPFRQWFEQGQPILMYHKLGPRPGRVRLKGLYVSQSLFARQLQELQLAGFRSGRLEACLGPSTEKRVVLTFDDGYQNVLRHGLEPLAQTRFRAITFLVAGRLGQHNDWDVRAGEAPEPLMDKAQVQEWLAAGHDIGSHTLTHPFLTQLPRAQAQEEISASRKKLEDLFGRPIEHFCYPYGDWNPGVRDLVQEAGYKTACTTLAGLNSAADSLFVLKRFLVRYPSRSLKAMWARLRARFL